MNRLAPLSLTESALRASTAGKLADHYADLIAAAWREREAKLANPTLDFADLIRFDDRLQAGIDALLLLEDHARAHLQSLLDEPVRAGELFAMALYALLKQDQAMWDASLGLFVAIPGLQQPLLDALLWAPASPFLDQNIQSLPPALHLESLGQRAHGTLVPSPAWLRDAEPTPDNISAALQFIRWTGNTQSAAGALNYLNHPNTALRLVAAQTILTLGTAEQAPAALSALATLLGEQDARLRATAVRCLVLHHPDGAPWLLEQLGQDPDESSLYLQALGWSGQIAHVPTLIARLEDERDARIAAASLALLTGSDPARDGWLAPHPTSEMLDDEDGDAIPDRDPHKHLPWPNPGAFVQWWQANQQRFIADARYLLGAPLTPTWLRQVVQEGPLPWRALAAEHLQRLGHGPLFPTHAPAATQHGLFAGFNWIRS